MSALALETFDARSGHRAVRSTLATNSDVQQWELCSELVLVCPEIRRRALELLPERDPDAFLSTPATPIALPEPSTEDEPLAAELPAAVSAYAIWRLAETARIGLPIVAVLVALASLAELLH